MKKFLSAIALAGALVLPSCSSQGLDYTRLLSAGVKATQAATISDEQVQAYVRQYVTSLDQQNKVLPASNKYSKRLANLTSGLTSVDGIPLNFKVYQTDQINAFACADGSVRVYSGIMDVMTDNELLGIIGHEIGHVAHKHSKKAFKEALLSSALRGGISSAGGTVAALTDSQLGDLAESMMSAKYSRKQEEDADNYAYSFLRQNGKNPWALAYAFEKMEKLEQQNGMQSTALTQLFSSHPDTRARINNIISRCKKDGIAQPSNK